RPPVKLILCINITGVPILSTSLWGGIPGKVIVFRYSFGKSHHRFHGVSPHRDSCRCSSRSTTLLKHGRLSHQQFHISGRLWILLGGKL
nr:hypothetical protein [Tanacetum cinerariifolium]